MGRNRLFDEDAVVIGLGRFGAACALEMQRMGYRVHALERNPDRAEKFARKLHRVVLTNAADPDELASAKIDKFRIAVVAIGTSIESSLLTSGNLVDLGIPRIWAKAMSSEHASILRRIGVNHVVFPEADSGNRVAHVVNGKLTDFIRFDDDYAIVRMTPPREMVGLTLTESDIRSKYGITVVGVKTPGKPFTYATEKTKVQATHVLVVSGRAEQIEHFASRP